MLIKGLGESLAEQKIITLEQLGLAGQKCSAENIRLSKALILLNYISEEKLLGFFKKNLELPVIELTEKNIDAKVIQELPAAIARKYHVIPIAKTDSTLRLVMADPLDDQAVTEIEYVTKARLEVFIASYSQISIFLDKYYGIYTSIKKIVDNLRQGEITPLTLSSFDKQIFEEDLEAGPINQILYLIISQAVQENASDIHLEPHQNELMIRFRIDGVLHPAVTFPKHIADALISSIKILAKMDIAEKRIPLDGGFQVKVESKIIDLRISSFPVIDGEKIAMRLLDKEKMLFSLRELGLNKEMLKQLQILITQPYGMVLVVGPTGSGKTTTLYSVLDTIRSQEKNIVTIEDPIEYHLDQINQSQINIKAGLTFARGLRSFLRQDPDVILVGEIRDKETAEIAIQAALTGHLVFSTLHTNDATSAITRLIDMGIEPFLIASALTGVIGQRLVRKICSNCQTEFKPSEEVLQWCGLQKLSNGEAASSHFEKVNLDVKALFQKNKLYKGKGCSFCKGQGLKGRIGIFELMVADEGLKKFILKGNASAEELRTHARQAGMVTLKEDGILKSFSGITSLDEVMRVAR